ncbi:hypothetical protein QKW35_18170 [Pontibacterium granulatum]|uniref:hypothetical protein n=1 Tax=Pontibacterium granulatum TaxID=2036029 RepID=UPI00249B647E|nr:hypothetical protein [Pontibacterium granulatum]MDI3326307.1 hypothetical protein [Pontibacterium granulatum]
MKNKTMISTAALIGASAFGMSQTVLAGDYEHLQEQVTSMKAEIEKMQSQQGKGTVSTHSDKVRLEVSGHVNRAIQGVDDGSDTYLNSVDNDNSSTRVRFIAESDLSSELVMGGALEVQLESNSTYKINQLNEESGDGTATFTERRAEIYFDHERFGKLWLGQGWAASDNVSELDLSGTFLANGAYAGGGAGLLFRNADGSLDSTTLYSLTSDLDGLGRNDRIRYDTPEVGGFSFATSAVQGGAWDIAGRYGYEDDGMHLMAALAYSDSSRKEDSDIDSRVNGSVAVLFDSGWNGLVSFGADDLKSTGTRAANGADPSNLYTKIGYRTTLNDMGLTSFSVDYRLSEEQQRADEEVKGYGFQVAQQIRDFKADVYFGVNQYERTAPGKNFDDITVALVGARIRF